MNVGAMSRFLTLTQTSRSVLQKAPQTFEAVKYIMLGKEQGDKIFDIMTI